MTLIASYSMGLISNDLHVWVDSSDEFVLDWSEHEFNGIERWSVGRNSDCHPSSVRAEVLHHTSQMDGSVIEYQDNLTSKVFKSRDSVLISWREVGSKEVFHFKKELYESCLSVDASSELTHVHAVIHQSTDSVCLWRHLKVLYWSREVPTNPRVRSHSSRVEANFINPDESSSLSIEHFKDSLIPLSVSYDIISSDVCVSDVGLSVAMVQIKFDDVGNCSGAHLGRIPCNLVINVLLDSLCSNSLPFQSKKSLLDSSDLQKLLVCFK